MKRGRAVQSELTVELLEQMAQMLRLLAHRHRLKIVALLRHRPEGAPCHELMALSGVNQSMLSLHVNLMRRAGLLRADRRGREVWYHLADRRPLRLLDCLCQGGQCDEAA